MENGFVRVATANTSLRVGDIEYNAKQIIQMVKNASDDYADVLVFPELALTSYTCGDLFWQPLLLNRAKDYLKKIIEETKEFDVLVFVGLPYLERQKVYNVMAVFKSGKLLAFIPKTNIPNYAEFYEKRHFSEAPKDIYYTLFDEVEVPFGTDIQFVCQELNELVISCEICEDLWMPNPPSIRHAMAGATLIVNGSASNAMIGKDKQRERLVTGQSERLICAYAYACAGEGESTTDLVFAGDNMISENGHLLERSMPFANSYISTDIDVKQLVYKRNKMDTFETANDHHYSKIAFSLGEKKWRTLKRFIEKKPFVPADKKQLDERCEEILAIQSRGLKKRLDHIHTQKMILGLSGGLDSTLALLVAIKTADMSGFGRENIITVTMPCFGTTDRTYKNACTLASIAGTTLKEINISEAVCVHLKDIEHDMKLFDVTYENAQARERTQVLMDLANQYNGIVVGTGDLSELALGFATYNGDHMSMYGVNASIPKTLVKYLVDFYARKTKDEKLKSVLLDIVDTPVSPELLPPSEGEIAQKTEEIVGPYELHDFYLYHFLRNGCDPKKIYYMANHTFDEYDKEIIKKWLHLFFKRFFANQYKRSCLPDGPKVGSVCLSPRGDLRMPSDAMATLWLEEIDKL